MLFGHPSVQEASAIKSLLNLFSEASGTTINASKSQLFFFHTPILTQRNIARILGFPMAALASKYLGAPLFDSAIKHASWRSLLDNLESRLSSWTYRSLIIASRLSSWTYRSLIIASRLILIKSVLQAMPLYLFSILAAPKWVLKKFTIFKETFFGVPQASIENGLLSNGLRFVFRSQLAKYAPGSPLEDFIRINTFTPGSLIWNVAKKHSAFIQVHSFWEIHSGTIARFWEDSWQQLPKLTSLFHKPKWQATMQHNDQIHVHQFWQQQSPQGFQLWRTAGTWQANWQEETYEEIGQELKVRKIKLSDQHDKVRWGYTPKASPQECLILKNWNLYLTLLAQVKPNSSIHTDSPQFWSPPATHSYKLNFDGAAKENPGLASYGGIFRDVVGSTLHIYHGSLGRDTNNVVEFEGLWKGISIAEIEIFFPLEVEGDSQILIEAAIWIHLGTSVEKIASIWWLLSRLEQIEEWLKAPRSITFKHIRRTTNKVADRLANQGVDQ
eukprot:PITA_23835